jgi:hypothetical protein
MKFKLKRVYIGNWFKKNDHYYDPLDETPWKVKHAKEEDAKNEILDKYLYLLNKYELLLHEEYEMQNKISYSDENDVHGFKTIYKTIIEERNGCELTILNVYDSVQINFSKDPDYLKKFANAREYIDNIRTYMLNEHTFQKKIKKLVIHAEKNKENDCVDFMEFCRLF